jgi:Bacterial alpha-L-rhamnosidase C-terminal domain
LIGFAKSGSCGHYGYSDCGHETYVNALYKRNLDEMAGLAAALGKDGSAYASRSRAVADAIDAKLWDGDAGAYRMSLELPNAHPQDANAAAVLTGVAGDRASRALAFLRAHTWSRFGSLTIDPAEANASLTPFYAPLPSGFEAQARFSGTGEARGIDTVAGMELVRRFWGYQLSQDPHSTLWEHVKTDGTPNLAQFSSLAHGWAAGPTESLTTDVLGVNPTGAGFSRFDVAPHPGDLRWAQGAVPTPHGTIEASWTRKGDDRFSLTVKVPGGTRARVVAPSFGRRVEVRADGRRAAGSTVELGPGRHTVTSRAVDRPAKTVVQAVLTPGETAAAPGDTVALRLGLAGAGDLRGTITVTGPDGWNVSPDSVPFDLGRDGAAAGKELRLYAEVPDDAAGGSYPVKVLVRTRGARASATATIRLTVEKRLFDFEDGVQGWTAGANVSGVAKVGSFANGPGRPFEGTGALEATVPPTDASALKTVKVAKALDLSAASELHAHLDCYGGVPGASGYEATITVSAGSDARTKTQPISCDSWNTLSVDLTGWAGRSAVTGIEVGFRALGTTFVWSPRFQIDDVGATT